MSVEYYEGISGEYIEKMKLLEAKVLQFHTILEKHLNKKNMEFLKLEMSKTPVNEANIHLLFEKMANQPVLKLYNEHFGIKIDIKGKI